jgi:uncharacterized membrane protein
VNSPAAPEPWRRRAYLDWLRGIAVLIMIEAHTLDSWTRLADRQSPWYQNAIILAGFGAPLFLFLAGIALMLAAGSRIRKGMTLGQAARAAFRRGAWVFLLALLFRLQSFVLGGGQSPQSLLKVDILNVMGVSMLAASIGLACTATRKARTWLFTGLTGLIAMLTPLIRESSLLGALPDPLEAYFRPMPGLTNFTLFPWAGFLTGGCVVGAWLVGEGSGRLSLAAVASAGEAARPDSSDADSRVNRWLVAIGAAVAVAGYFSSMLPPLYPHASFWTSSPTFFFMRLGILAVSVPAAFALTRFWRGQWLQEFGQASLFVYWVHVELVYGVLSAPIHRRLPFGLALAAFGLFTAAMFGLVRLKSLISRRGRSPNVTAGGDAASKSTIAAVSRNQT